ncbi:MAG: hypothetical protein ACPGYX_10280, partial [Oceanobacter sp.]
YSSRFCSSLIRLYELVTSHGAEVVGSWPTDGYTFEHSDAVVDGSFVGLAIDHRGESFKTDERIAAWKEYVLPLLAESDAVSV